MKRSEIKEILDDVMDSIHPGDFIANDPISIPHSFTKKQDVEIAAFLACTLAWGNRKTIMSNTQRLMHWMGNEPHRFIIEHSEEDLKPFASFVHRTFNGTDCLYFIDALRHCYGLHDSLENLFVGDSVRQRIIHFRAAFFALDHAPERTQKHVANPAKNSSAKRLNMFLRWMVRSDAIDLGIWKSIPTADLKCPLDVHVQRAAFHFGLLQRKQQDWKAVEELSDNLLKMSSVDPIQYDMALFKYSELRLSNL